MKEVKSILHIIFFAIAFVSLMLLLHFDLHFLLAFFITFLILMVCNYIAGYIIVTMQRNALDSDCDPQRYLAMLDKQEKRFRKKERIQNYLAINRAAAYMVMGDYKIAKEYMDGIELSELSERNGSYLIYIINKILCYYELGEIEMAEKLYESELIRLSPIGKRLQKTTEILIGERYYHMKRYDLSYEHLKKLLNVDLNKRQYLGVLYRLAQMDEANGDMIQATVKYKKIIKHGNKLGIVKASKEALERL